VLYVGGYDVRKNVDVLARAFDQSGLLSHSLVIAAEKRWEFSKWFEGWKRLAGFPRMRCLEAESSELAALYRQADFFVNPSLWESFSFQLTEAMACGTPLLCSNRTALPEIAGDAAVYFDPEQPEELADQLRRLAGDAGLKNQLRQRGFERVKAFTWRETAKQTMAVYRRVVSRAAGIPAAP
jgi:glycosyltransferase involved in cell wall biosynthesis